MRVMQVVTGQNIKRYILLCCLLGVLVISCKPKKEVVYSTTPVEEKANNELFNDIVSKSFSYSTLSSKLNITFTSGSRSLSSKANLLMEKDHAIQISVQPLFGVEMFRFYIDPDTLVLLDRMNKRYIKEPILSLKEHYPVGFDFYTMQSILTNRPFVSGKREAEGVDYTEFHFSKTSGLNYYLTAADDQSGVEYSFTVNGDDRITFTHIMQPQKRHSLQWAYSHFVLLDETPFPHKMNAIVSSKSRDITMELLFTDIVKDSPMSLSIAVPISYRKATIEDVLKIISPSK